MLVLDELTTYEVMNISSRNLGSGSESQRNVMTKISCLSPMPVTLGDALSVKSESERTCRKHEVGLLQQNMSSQVSESLRIATNAPEYSSMDFLIELLFTPASVGQSKKSPELITLQKHSLSMQVSKTWQYNSDAGFLLLTSKSTTKETIASWTQFIEKHLHMSLDVWNVSLYGGLEAEATRKSVLDGYTGKTVLALDDDLFEYCDRGERSILDFVDPDKGSALSRNGTRVVSVQRKAETRRKREGNNIEQLAHAPVLKDSPSVANDFRPFHHTSELIAHLRVLREKSSTSAANEQYFIPFDGKSAYDKGRKVTRKLNKAFPLDQFIVTNSTDGHGLKIVHCGAHGQGYSTAQVAQSANGVGRMEEFSGLNPAEAYACVAALPLKGRLDILLISQRGMGELQYSAFVQDAALSSVKAELHEQVQAMAKQPRWRDGLFSRSDDISTKSVFDLINDNIETTLRHDLLLNANADDAASPAGQILRSVIQSAQCQTTKQLLCRWLSPVKRTRSHVRRNLMGKVQTVIASGGQNGDLNAKDSKERIKNFRRSVSQPWHHKNYQANINSGVQNITLNAIQDVKQSLTSIEEVMPASVYKSPDELSIKKNVYEKATLRRKQDQQQHREWKEELGLDIAGCNSVEIDSVTDPGDDSAFNSPQLTTISTNIPSTTSDNSDVSTPLTIPEVVGSWPSHTEELHELHAEISDCESRPATPRPKVDSIPEMIGDWPSDPEELDELQLVISKAGTVESLPPTASSFEVVASSPTGSSPAASLHGSQTADANPDDGPLIWSEYDEDELRLDLSLDAFGSTDGRLGSEEAMEELEEVLR